MTHSKQALKARHCWQHASKLVGATAASEEMVRCDWSFAGEAGNRFQLYLQSLMASCSSDDNKALDAQIFQTLEHLKAATDLLESEGRAYGGKARGEAWSKPLRAKSSEADVESVARDSGLLDLDVPKLLADTQSLDDNFKKYKEACGQRGKIIDESFEDTYRQLRCRSVMTSVEAEVLRVLTSDADHEKKREVVKKEVVKLRAASKAYKEQELMPLSLYKWMYTVLTSKH